MPRLVQSLMVSGLLASTAGGCGVGLHVTAGPTVTTSGEVGWRAGGGLSFGGAASAHNLIELRQSVVAQGGGAPVGLGLTSTLGWHLVAARDAPPVGALAGVRLATAAPMDVAADDPSAPISLGIAAGPLFTLAGSLSRGQLLWAPSTSGMVITAGPELDFGWTLRDRGGGTFGIFGANIVLDWVAVYAPD